VVVAFFSCAPAGRAGDWSLRLRAQASEEYDSNAQRLQRVTGPPGTEEAEGVVGDFLTRLLLRAELGYHGPELSMQSDLACGAKLFYRETSEHVVATQLGLSLFHAPSERRRVGLRLGLADTTQASHSRDYLMVHADLVLGLAPIEPLQLEVFAGGRAFRFKPDPERFDHAGPALGLTARLPLGAGFDASLGYQLGVRFFRAARSELVSLTPPVTRPGDARRQDERHGPLARVRFRAAWWDELRLLAQLGYGFSDNRSNSAGSAARWHRLEGLVALQLPYELTLQVMGSLQLTGYPDGLYLDSETYQPDADENENAFVARVGWRFWEGLQLVVQAAIYRNSFAAGEAGQPRFARETYQLGLAWDWEPL
jgi:hypothetical protein